jgi:hypothetical protein
MARRDAGNATGLVQSALAEGDDVTKWVLAVGLALVILAVGSYVATGAQSMTALIPAIPGALFIALALIGMRGPGARKHAMHVAAALALLGVLGTAPMSLPRLFAWMGGTTPERPAAVFSQAVMALLCLILLIVAIRSFIAARRAREAGGAGVP